MAGQMHAATTYGALDFRVRDNVVWTRHRGGRAYDEERWGPSRQHRRQPRHLGERHRRLRLRRRQSHPAAMAGEGLRRAWRERRSAARSARYPAPAGDWSGAGGRPRPATARRCSLLRLSCPALTGPAAPTGRMYANREMAAIA
jgi:hypothetical protein